MNRCKTICNLENYYLQYVDRDSADVEYCGAFIYDGSCYVNKYEPIRGTIVIDKETGKKRNTCQHVEYDRVIWHSHPYTAKSYPSAEDVIKIMKNNIYISIIFTRWGIWQLHYDKVDCSYRDIAIYEAAKTKINGYGNIIYHNTDRGDLEYLDNNALEYIKRYIDSIWYTYKIYIQFDRWEDLYNDICIVRDYNPIDI
jgi:hypothetical protein